MPNACWPGEPGAEAPASTDPARPSHAMRLPAALSLSPRWAPYVLISPFLILFFVFGMFPLAFSLYLAFQTWEPTAGMQAMQFVGLENFAFSLQDEWFWKSLKNTGWVAVASGVPQHVVAIPLAVFIHTSFKRLRDGVIGAYFLPYITSTVAIAIMFSSLFSTDYGVVNTMLNKFFGVKAIDWLGAPQNIKPKPTMAVANCSTKNSALVTSSMPPTAPKTKSSPKNAITAAVLEVMCVSLVVVA